MDSYRNRGASINQAVNTNLNPDHWLIELDTTSKNPQLEINIPKSKHLIWKLYDSTLYVTFKPVRSTHAYSLQISAIHDCEWADES